MIVNNLSKEDLTFKRIYLLKELLNTSIKKGI